MKETTTIRIEREVDGHIATIAKSFDRLEIEAFSGGEDAFLHLVYLRLQRQLDKAPQPKQP